jgi:23S rRNA pseudouridine1911/1915/1917 synthase
MTPATPDNISPSSILYEDNHLIIINKKPSELIQGDKTGDEPLSEKVKRYIKAKYNKPGDVFLGVVHRLDRPVSGAVVFARTSKALGRMNELLRDRAIAKRYWAVTVKRPDMDTGQLVHYLKKNQQKNISFVYDQPGDKRLKAELKYHYKGSSDNYHLLEVELLTGRHHQIRAQLSRIGCPIKGDLKYGAPRSNKDGSIHLHARTIHFIHPVRKETLSITAEPPDEPIWNFFVEKYGT